MILVVAATERELEGAAGAETLVCGIGPVEAALATATRLAAGDAPTALIHIGIAGAATLDTGTIVLGSESLYCDIVDPASVIPRVERLAPDHGLLDVARRVLPDARVLPIATSARVGGGSACEVEAMEGFGVLRAAALVGVPAVELRAISNAVSEPDRALWRIDDALAALAAATAALVSALA